MKGNKILLSLALALFTTGMNAQDIINVTVKNTIGERNDAPVVVKLNKGNKEFLGEVVGERKSEGIYRAYIRRHDAQKQQ